MSKNDLIRTQSHVTFSAASAAIKAGVQKAEEIGVRVGIVVTDGSGFMVAMARMDGAPGRVEEAAGGKARAAGGMGIPTAEFIEKRLQHNEALWRAISARPDTFMVQGGYPLKYKDQKVGGIGVSGAKHEEDSQVAEAGAAAFAALAEGSPQAVGS